MNGADSPRLILKCAPNVTLTEAEEEGRNPHDSPDKSNQPKKGKETACLP